MCQKGLTVSHILLCLTVSLLFWILALRMFCLVIWFSQHEALFIILISNRAITAPVDRLCAPCEGVMFPWEQKPHQLAAASLSSGQYIHEH